VPPVPLPYGYASASKPVAGNLRVLWTDAEVRRCTRQSTLTVYWRRRYR